MSDMDEALRAGVVQVRTRPHVNPPWKGSGGKGGGTVTTKREWTRQSTIGALQAWAEAHGGRAPRQHELGRHAEPALPNNSVLQKLFGGVRNAVIEAGLPPAPKGARKDRARHPVPATTPEAGTEQQGEPQGDGEVTPLDKLVADLKDAERELGNLRQPYIDARDRVQLLRLEIIELMQVEDGAS